MKLRGKLLLFLSAIMIIWLSFMVYIMNTYAMEGYRTLENEKFTEDIRRTTTALENLLTQYHQLLLDWTHWDDAYAFINKPYDQFIEGNITSSLFDEQSMHYILIFDHEDRLVVSRFAYPDMPILEQVPQELVDAVLRNKNKSGLVLINDAPVLFTAYEVTNSNNTAEPDGLFCFGQILTQDDIFSLGDEIAETISYEDPHMVYESSDTAPQVHIDNDGTTAEIAIPYMNADQALLLRLYKSHEVTDLGYRITGDVVLISSTFIVLLSAVLFWGVRHSVLRILDLKETVSSITHSRDLNRRVHLKGNDEVATLANDINDMLDRIEVMNAQLAEYASFDVMTGVLNRRVGFEKLEMFMKESDAHGFPLSICFVDINNLKEVNDTHGHAVGDELIVTMTDQILTHIRSTDVICRVGGDEFLIIFPTCDLPDAKHTMNRVQSALTQFNNASDKPYTLSLSMGFAAYEPPMDRTSFVEVADNNMYNDKRQRKNKNGPPV